MKLSTIIKKVHHTIINGEPTGSDENNTKLPNPNTGKWFSTSAGTWKSNTKKTGKFLDEGVE